MKVLSKNGKPILVDGKVICVDEVKQIEDVKINGESIVSDGVADIPIANGKRGVVKVQGYGMSLVGDVIAVRPAVDNEVIARNAFVPLGPNKIDLAVKTAMCDGKGAAWTDEEKTNAQIRMGILSVEEVTF